MTDTPRSSEIAYARRVLIAIALGVLGFSLAYFVSEVAGVLVVLFAGVLLAVFLDGLTRLLRRVLPVSRPWALLITIALLLVLFAAGVRLLGAPLADQLTSLANRLPSSLEQVRERILEVPWGNALLERLPEPRELFPMSQNIVPRVLGLFSTALGTLTTTFVIVSLGLYLAIDPPTYLGALRRLVPVPRRRRVDEVAMALGRALRHWIIGRLSSMLLVGVLTGLGLWAIGTPLPLSLAFVTALVVFIPYIGPILSVIPALLVALSQSFALALYTLLLYLLVQLLESYLVTPVIQKRAVSLPPGFLISAQVVAGVLFGGFGLALAAPFAVVVTVVIQMLYVEDMLGDRSTAVLGDHPFFGND